MTVIVRRVFMTVRMTLLLLYLLLFHHLSQQLPSTNPTKLHLHHLRLVIQTPRNSGRHAHLVLPRQIDFVHQKQIGGLDLLCEEFRDVTHGLAGLLGFGPVGPFAGRVPRHPIGAEGACVDDGYCAGKGGDAGCWVSLQSRILPIFPHRARIRHPTQLHYNRIQLPLPTPRQPLHGSEQLILEGTARTSILQLDHPLGIRLEKVVPIHIRTIPVGITNVGD
mmetsp:Transcript_97/g.206  ORF Transcript_97/g.206 Transcript_97/m.206 type:complete len:221 (+) Transcript_97:1-663(+)